MEAAFGQGCFDPSAAAVEEFETLGDEAERVASREKGFVGEGGRFVDGVGDDDLVVVRVEGEGDGDFASFEEMGNPVADGVFDDRLEGEGRDLEVGGGGGVREGEAEAGAEAGAFDVEIVADEVEFGGEGDGLAVAAGHGATEEVGELAEDALGLGGLVRDDGGDGVEGVEEEMGADLGLERAGLGEGGGQFAAGAAVVGAGADEGEREAEKAHIDGEVVRIGERDTESLVGGRFEEGGGDEASTGGEESSERAAALEAGETGRECPEIAGEESRGGGDQLEDGALSDFGRGGKGEEGDKDADCTGPTERRELGIPGGDRTGRGVEKK